jgi:SSS family solute:Na+ symporter
VEIAVLAAYAALVLWTGCTAEKHSAEAFYVNNRAGGAWNIAFSIVVSCVGASAVVGMIGMAFTVGVPAFWWLGAGAAGLTVLSFFLAGAVRRSGAYTLPHMVETFLGHSARPVIAIVIVVAWAAILAAQFAAMGKILEPLTGFPPLICLGVGFLLICGHTVGGQSAVMRVDTLQAVIIVSSLVTMLAWLSWRNPSWTESVVFEVVNSSFPPEKLLYFLVVVGGNYVVCPMLFGRMLSARDERNAKLGGLIGAGGIVFCAALIVAVGLACKGLMPASTPQDEVLTGVLAGEMPRWMHIVISFALISAIVSSADSCLVTAATVFSYDLLGRSDAVSGRFCVVTLGATGALISLWGKDILGFLLMAYDIFACGVVPPVLVGLLFHPRRLGSFWSCAAVGAGGLLGLLSAASENALFSYAGIAVSLAVALGGVLQGGTAQYGEERSPGPIR